MNCPEELWKVNCKDHEKQRVIKVKMGEWGGTPRDRGSWDKILKKVEAQTLLNMMMAYIIIFK